MPKYLFKGSYSQSGIAGVMKDGASSRVAAARSIAESVGGSLEAFYFAFGGHDFYAIGDLPDHASAVALAATIGASGAMSQLETVVLISPEEGDAAAEKAVSYRPPGS